jgi:hypothetical protein
MILTNKLRPHALPWVLASTALLTACGGGGNAAPNPASTAQANLGSSPSATTDGSSSVLPAMISVSGRVMNQGYLGNTQVCFDLNDDGLCNIGEPTSTTNAQGAYALSVPTGHRGGNLLAVVRPDSADSAATTANPITIQQGWTWATLLEYEDGATAATVNISPITATYYARLRQAGRNRLSSQIAMFTRIVYETNLDPTTGKQLLPIDFDYVSSPKNALSTRVKAIGTVLSARAATAGAPLSMLTTTAVMNAWYNTYTGPTSTLPAVPVDATKIATLTGNNTPEAYLANDNHYFRPKTDAALRLRDGLSETAGFNRIVGSGAITKFLRRSTTLSSGSVVFKLAEWVDGIWSPLTSDEGSYFTTTPKSELVLNSGTDYLQPRTITQADGNRVTFRMPGNQARLAFETADSPATNFFIEEWVGQQRSYASYYNGTAPITSPVTIKPACAITYPGSPQPDAATGTTASAWFSTCFNYYSAEYYDLVAGDLQLTGTDPKVPGADFYDGTLYDPLVVLPATQSCGADPIVLEKVTTLGQAHCNWAVNAQNGHSLTDLFASGGVALNSWSKSYGSASFTTGNGSSAVTTVKTAGSTAQVGLPQQLRLTLNRTGSETSGTGTLYSEYGAWTAGSNTATTENITWAIDPINPKMVLISWPFRDVNDPRVKTNTTSAGAAAPSAPVLTAHFSATFNGNTYSLTPSTHTAPNYRKLAIVLQDGVFVVGQYYGPGYTYNERYFTSSAMEKGLSVLNYVFGKLYNAGFTDQ